MNDTPQQIKELKLKNGFQNLLQKDLNSLWKIMPPYFSFGRRVKKRINHPILRLKINQLIHLNRQALQLGWNPEEKGIPLVYDLIDDKLVKRKFNK